MRLNVNLNNANTADALKKASAAKAGATETMDEAWARIFAQKNTDADLRKLQAVKAAFEAGKIGRALPGIDKNGKPKKLGRFSKAEALRLYAQLAESMKAEKLRELVEHMPKNYHLITSVSELTAMIARALNEEQIAVDTETTGLDVYTDVIVGVSITTPSDNQHYYVAFEPTEDERALPASELQRFKRLMADGSVKKVLHNAMYDIAMFRRHGINLEGLAWDTQIAMHVLNENEESFALKNLATKYLHEPSDTFSTLFGKDAKFAEIPLDIALAYAAKDTDVTWRLYQFQLPQMQRYPEMYEYYTTVEVPLLCVIVDLEANGYILDLDFAKKYGQELHEQAETLHAKIIEALSPYHEGELNVNSTQQMRPALSKLIGKELPNMDAKRTLKPLAGKHGIIADLLEYKRVTKLSSTYIDSLPLKQNPTTKRWHSRFNPMGTVTGRFSSGKEEGNDSQFNVQNQPYAARKMFVAPPGKVLIGADFKAQEIRCVAHLSGEPVLINAFKEGLDPYASMASMFYKRPYEEVYKKPDGSDTKERKEFKVVWLASLYGMSDASLGELLGTSKADAIKFKNDIFGKMPKLGAWLAGNTEFAKKNGFVWMDGNKRKRRLPDAKLKKKNIPYGKYYDEKYSDDRLYNAKIGRAVRQATNARVQGSSAIQTKVTMIEAHEICKQREGWRLWGTVHDELLFEVPENFTREDARIIESIMLNSYAWGTVENGTDLEVMRVWGEGMTVDDWFKTKGER